MDHEHVQIFYCFYLLQQMFPAGIAEVIFFATFSKNDKKAKREPTFFFLTNASSLFFDTKKEHLNDLDTLNLYFF